MNTIIIKDNLIELHTLKADSVNIVVLIDIADLKIIQQYKWYASFNKHVNNYYIYYSYKENNKTKNIYLHRLISNCPKHLQVDHVNHNTIDNRRCNLRIVTCKENMQNLKQQFKKIDKDIVKDILASKLTDKELSKQYNISSQHVFNIRHGLVSNYLYKDITRQQYKNTLSYRKNVINNRLKNKSAINMYTSDNILVKEFANKKEIFEYFKSNFNKNICDRNLQRHLVTLQKSCYGYIFRYQ